MKYLINRRRQRQQQPTETHLVVHHDGRPVASAVDAAKARGFVHTRVDIGFVHSTTTWTATGKFLVNGRWTGWEIREVPAL